jgi:hypothetical protein
VIVAGMMLSAAGSARGHGGRPLLATALYYCPFSYSAPVVYYTPVYAVPRPVLCPVPRPAVVPYAVPTPAPASQTPEPPLKTAPKVTETRSPSGSAGTAASDKGCCQVGFWNVTSRDLTLTVEGQTRLLPRNQSLTLRLGRQFSWRVDQRTPQTAQVPANKSTLEIVIRQ